MDRRMIVQSKIDRANHVRRMERALIGTLAFALCFFMVMPKRRSDEGVPLKTIEYQLESYELPPPTRVSRHVAPPALPRIPIVSEDATLPEEVTIEETVLDIDESLVDEIPEMATVNEKVVFVKKQEEEKPAPPGSIELALLIDAYGRVDSLYVVKNPSGNKRALDEAIRRAYRTIFIDERPTQQTMKWIRRKF